MGGGERETFSRLDESSCSKASESESTFVITCGSAGMMSLYTIYIVYSTK